MKNRRNRQNIVMFVLCILLFLALAALLIWSRKEDAREAQRLRQIASGQETEQTESGEEEPQSSEKTSGKDGNPETDDNGNTGAHIQIGAEPDRISETASEDEKPQVEGIVCWGDDLINGEASATDSYRIVLQHLLDEKKYDLTVVDKTLQGAGTLSMMTMAGVDSTEVQEFITAHEAAAGGAQLYITEYGIRDLTEEQTTRTDLGCIPVIFMGYYGGWNHDPEELIRQQEKILETFPNQEQFIVAGTRPVDGSVDTATLDNAMKAHWGEHYISLGETTEYPAATKEAQEALAGAVMEKLEELKFITK